MSRLGDLIRLERTRRNLTCKQVARLCGVSDKFLQDVESGRRIIADDQARRILKAMGLKEHSEADFTLDDIASTVDLQSAMPRIINAQERRQDTGEGRKTADKNADRGAEKNTGPEKVGAGSIWLDALSGVLKHVPVYNAVMKEVDHRLLPITDGRIAGAPADKVYYSWPRTTT